ncbi:C40 family peptidase [Anaerotignum sp.]|uniref:C40 family peptidase n=1 Tax=Anaerotignum sp. TaxID=2039241 RepID=UPI0028A8DCE8|nr:C40 family peptidase [Anaerotignum sp.]
MEDKLKKSRLKLEKAEERLDKAAEKIPKKKQRQIYKKGRSAEKSKLQFEEEVTGGGSNGELAPESIQGNPKPKKKYYEKEKPKSKLNLEESIPKPSDKLMNKPNPHSKLTQAVKTAPQKTLKESIHKEISKTEDENVGVKTAHSTEQSAEFVGRKLQSAYHHQKLKPYKNLEKAERNLEKAQVNHTFNKAMAENPQAGSNPLSKWKQKHNIKKQYAKARKAGTATHKTATTVKNTVKKGADAVGKVVVSAVKNPKVLLIAGVILLVLVVVGGMFSSCSVMLQGGLNSIVGTSYNSEDEDIVEVEGDYKALEKALQEEIDNIESDYPDYDEYRYHLDEIGHNAHELASYLTALLTYYKPSEVQGELQQIFNLQYELELERIVEIRYRTETRTDSEGNSYTVEVPYEYYILNVTLTNTPMKDIAKTLLIAEQFKLFQVYLEMKGNKPDIFGDKYSEDDSGQDTDYQVPPHYLTDAQFGAMLAEAEKYLGYPYVWGGSNPQTSFDCSGFVCWVINQSGVGNIPRTTATGIYNQTTPIPQSEAKPGDIIFFEGTYDSAGAVSHVGIYVGDGMMLHCGNPIGYANVSSGYWQDHLYGYGRIN